MLHPAFADFAAVDVECDRAALREAAAVIVELHPHLMRARRDRRGAFDRVAVHAVKVVAIFRLAALGVEAPAADDSAERDDDAFGPGGGTTTSAVTACDLFLVLMIELSVSRPMPRNRNLPVALDQLRPAGDVGIGALGKPVVQRQHVVLDRLDQPQPLQFVQLVADAPWRGPSPGVQSVVVS